MIRQNPEYNHPDFQIGVLAQLKADTYLAGDFSWLGNKLNTKSLDVESGQTTPAYFEAPKRTLDFVIFKKEVTSTDDLLRSITLENILPTGSTLLMEGSIQDSKFFGPHGTELTFPRGYTAHLGEDGKFHNHPLEIQLKMLRSQLPNGAYEKIVERYATGTGLLSKPILDALFVQTRDSESSVAMVVDLTSFASGFLSEIDFFAQLTFE